MITALSVLALAIVYLQKIMYDRKESRKKELLDYAIALVEEGIAYSEEKNKMNKVEAAHNAGLSLKKQPVESTKDPIFCTRFFQAAMGPQREICHSNAKDYILKSVNSMKDESMKKRVLAMFDGVLDEAIKMRIAAAKMGTLDPVKPLLYRNLL